MAAVAVGLVLLLAVKAELAVGVMLEIFPAVTQGKPTLVAGAAVQRQIVATTPAEQVAPVS